MISRRQLQIAIGLLWLVDGVLQLQPFMFTSGFVQQILLPAGAGQPAWVAAPMHFFAGRIAQHPALLNGVAAAVQLALGAGFLRRRTARVAIVASIAWSIGVWWFAEGLGGLASAHASLLTGAPGAAILYGVLAAGCWPHRAAGQPDDHAAPARWLSWVWATIWVGGAALQLLPDQKRLIGPAAQIRDSAHGAPAWIAAIDRAAADVLVRVGTGGLVLSITLMAAVGLGALIPGRVRTAAAWAGAGVAALFWLVSQNLGQLYTGQATDPNSGVLLILFAAAVASTVPNARAEGIPAARTAPHPRSHAEPACLAAGSASPAHVQLVAEETAR